MSNYEFAPIDIALLRHYYPAPVIVNTSGRCVGFAVSYSYASDELVMWIINPEGENDLSIPIAQKVVYPKSLMDYDFRVQAFVLDYRDYREINSN